MKMRSLLAFLAMLVGCRRECAQDSYMARITPPEDRSETLRSELSTVVRMAKARGERAGSVDVLVLSGGGSRGAWGAGVLRGWRDAGRPKFSVVTGVSTGALLSTHAFLGTEADDIALAEVYNGGVTDGMVFRRRPRFMLLWSSSLTTLGPLEELIAKVVTDETIDRVAKAGEEGRRLYVASTNMDSGRLKVWNMVELAAQKQYALYRQVLLASSSVPVLHSPVTINGYLHVDGGVREQLLLRSIMFGVRKAMGPVASSIAGRADHPALRCWVVVNGKLDLAETCTSTSILGMALRGVEVQTAASAVGTLWQSFGICAEVGAEWKLARIPDWTPVEFDSQEFDPDGMRKLYEEGRAFGKAATQWESRVPVLEDSARGIE